MKLHHPIDWLNIALLLLSAGAAYVLPFEVFLFSYAVLGPLHYLTEISWLHQRQYFTTARSDALWLLLLAGALFAASFIVPALTPAPRTAAEAGVYQLRGQQAGAAIVYLALMGGVAMTAFRTAGSKVLFMTGAAVLLLGLIQAQMWIIFFAVFLPTLVHVYVFTAAFMLLGALRSRSLPGLAAFALLWGTGIWLLAYQPEVSGTLSEGVRSHYRLFEPLNIIFAQMLGAEEFDPYRSPLGHAIMRFIAFAYTYHYLNWFSKTSIIKWHRVDRTRLGLVFALWLAAVLLYWWDYRTGFIALYTLSFLHVFLEFPLNWRSFADLGKEFSGLARQGWRRNGPSHGPAIAGAESS
jgi:hypothetical protein